MNLHHVIQCFALATLVPVRESFRVAILGSGIAGSTAARKLAEGGIHVTVFETGYGIGGRTSTRITRDAYRYQFDHGAQYIGSPKTDEFRDTLNEWESKGWVKEWTGRFLIADGRDEDKKKKFVGCPGMHSICRNLLHHENIRVVLRTRANAMLEQEQWKLTHSNSGEKLGTFDWLIAGDRLSASTHRQDLPEDLEAFKANARKVTSVKSLVAMVAFASPLAVDFDGVQFTGKESKYGSLGWVARDTSKPGRERNDGKECWVLQSTPTAATEIISSLEDNDSAEAIREKAAGVLVTDFLHAIPKIVGAEVKMPLAVYSVGHRWNAAFPIPVEEITQMSSQSVPSKRFVACGDYFGKLCGRIEGAYLSGVSAADQVSE